MSTDYWITLETAMKNTGRSRSSLDRIIKKHGVNTEMEGGKTIVLASDLLAAIAKTTRGGDRRIQA